MITVLVDLITETQRPPNLVSPSAYDTAWVARLGAIDSVLATQSLDWLRRHQLEDGSWGAKQLYYFYDRLLCTLAATIALVEQGEEQDQPSIQRAQIALETMLQNLKFNPYETIGFEMIIPTLMSQALEMGIIQEQPSGFPARWAKQRIRKLAQLPDEMIDRSITLAFSSEMTGPENLHLLNAENLQEANGSVACSPAATAFFALHIDPNKAALGYLHEIANDGAVPCISPIDTFEAAWLLWDLALIGPLDDELLNSCRPYLDFLEEEWQPGKGIASSTHLTPIDSDATSVIYDVLTRFGRSVDIDAVLRFEDDDYFRCFATEVNPSTSANIHVLGALRLGGFEAQHPTVQKVVRFLQDTQITHTYWLCKWHTSPYYTTSHAIINAAGYIDADWVDDAVDWMLETQNINGSWGYHLPTVEETAYCLQALAIWKRHGGQVFDSALKLGAAWIAKHSALPYVPLWIGKCLYCPTLVVHSAVLSALALVQQG